MTDARTIAEGLISRALQIVVIADETPPAKRGENEPRRDYTAAELEELFFCVNFAAVKLRKVPGGEEAAERVYERAEAEFASRGLCKVTPGPCQKHHGVEHGREAQELRRGIEDVIQRQLDEMDMVAELRRLLDRVDARDSLAFVERSHGA